MGLALRQAGLYDLPRLGKIRHAAIMAQPETFWSHREKLAAANAWASMDIQKNFTEYRLLATEDDSAFCGWKDNYLAYLFLLPNRQGGGIGSALLRHAEEQISRTHDIIWLYAHPYSEKFYERHGFTKQAETANPFGTVVLHKFIKPFNQEPLGR